MATLHLRVDYADRGKKGAVETDIPYEDGQHLLPKEHPFDLNIYLGPDYGFSLNWVSIETRQRQIRFGYDIFLTLNEQGKAFRMFRLPSGEELVYQFELR